MFSSKVVVSGMTILDSETVPCRYEKLFSVGRCFFWNLFPEVPV